MKIQLVIDIEHLVVSFFIMLIIAVIFQSEICMHSCYD